jgi:OOP family OmpA-OmpF porin
VAVAVLALSALTALDATAQSPGSSYLMPSLTWQKPDKDWRVDDNNLGGGLRLGVPLNERWDLQFGATRNRAKAGSERYTQTLLGADALYLFSRDTWRPFLLGGLHWERDQREGVALAAGSRNSPALAYGGGLQWWPSERFGMQFDLRRVSGFLRNNEALGFKRSDNTYAQVGLIWAFGDAPAPAPAPRVAPPPPPPPAPAVVAPPPPAPVPPPPPPPPPPPQRITLGAEELFAFDSARLATPQPTLDRFADTYKRSGSSARVVISGHTDRLGSPAYNQRLSQRRAEAVRDYLVAQGMPAAQLQARGKGETEPKVTDCKQKLRKDLVACLAPNRRVELEPLTVEIPAPAKR